MAQSIEIPCPFEIKRQISEYKKQLAYNFLIDLRKKELPLKIKLEVETIYMVSSELEYFPTYFYYDLNGNVKDIYWVDINYVPYSEYGFYSETYNKTSKFHQKLLYLMKYYCHS